MLRIEKLITALLCASVVLAGCDSIKSSIRDDKAVAKVGKHKLYASQLRSYIPKGVSPSDSTNLALQYINTWAADVIYSEMAQSQLSKAEQDVTVELESYKRDLLRFRYEQRFLSDRLDTLVTEEQMVEYYEQHKNLFTLERPILKVRYIDIYKNVEHKDRIISLMSSNKAADVELTRSLADRYAIRYFDSSRQWMDAAALAREFGVDYADMLARMKQSYIIIESPGVSDVKAAYVREIRRNGIAPYEFCTDRIREYILSGRKHDLLVTLERSLLEQASDSGEFVIY